jgi:hypothetical protein
VIQVSHLVAATTFFFCIFCSKPQLACLLKEGAGALLARSS